MPHWRNAVQGFRGAVFREAERSGGLLFFYDSLKLLKKFKGTEAGESLGKKSFDPGLKECC